MFTITKWVDTNCALSGWALAAECLQQSALMSGSADSSQTQWIGQMRTVRPLNPEQGQSLGLWMARPGRAYWKMDLMRGRADARTPIWGLVARRKVWLRKDWLRAIPLGGQVWGHRSAEDRASSGGRGGCLRCRTLLEPEEPSGALRGSGIAPTAYWLGLRPLWSRAFGSAP